MGDFENINGSEFVDTIYGNSFENLIKGNGGDDILTGGSGSDTFIYAKGDGNDTILDFDQNEDSISYQGFNAGEVAAFTESYLDDGSKVILLTDGAEITLIGAFVPPENFAPVLTTSSNFDTNEDTPSLAIAFSATDPDGNALQYSFSDPTKGSVTNNGDGTYTYTPDANENGSDSFTITVNDGTVDVSKTVDVTINGLNDAPVLTTSAMLSIDEDTASSAIAFSATDVDGDYLEYSFSNPSKGSIASNGDGAYTYTPHANENGNDVFTITVNDGTVDVSQTVYVTINANDTANNAPVLKLATSLNVNENTPSSAIYFSAKDADRDSLIYTYSTPSKGSLIINEYNTNYTYTPDANETGSDSFTITVNDGIS